MGSINNGSQRIGWKFSTPLQASYLDTFLAGFTNPGLFIRPRFSTLGTGQTATLSIPPFSLLIEPADMINTEADENGDFPIKNIVKVTTNSTVQLTITMSTMAIGFRYTFADDLSTKTQWYGDFIALTTENIAEFDGIIIATVQSHEYDGVVYYSVTTSGADISDALLIKEGWDPNCWLSLISPRRAVNGILNKLEVRRHNGLFSGYMSGHAGVVNLSNLQYEVVPPSPYEYPNGNMPNSYNFFNLMSTGFSLCDGSDTLPLERPHGGIFALVDAYNVNPSTGGGNYTNFVNQLKIKPVLKEQPNFYYDSESGIIGIK